MRIFFFLSSVLLNEPNPHVVFGCFFMIHMVVIDSDCLYIIYIRSILCMLLFQANWMGKIILHCIILHCTILHFDGLTCGMLWVPQTIEVTNTRGSLGWSIELYNTKNLIVQQSKTSVFRLQYQCSTSCLAFRFNPVPALRPEIRKSACLYTWAYWPDFVVRTRSCMMFRGRPAFL